MKLKAVFLVQGSLPVILGLFGLLAGESAISGWGIEATPDLLTLNRIIAISTLTMGVIVFRIPAWVGNNLREPALIGGAINTAWVINVGYDINVGAMSGAGVTINLVLVIVFAILFFVMGARHKNS
jgi:hypothetical protein